MRVIVAGALLAFATVLSACGTPDPTPALEARLKALEDKVARQPAAPVPGLGEIMTLTQMRHAKLWFAGEAGNWELAQYEVDELREGFADVVQYHPTHPDVPRPLADLIAGTVAGPLSQLDRVVKARDAKGFAVAFDALSTACNSCHMGANHGFNVIRRPTAPPFGNQDFTPAAASAHRGG